MPKDFRDEEFERLLASGELPDIPEPSPERSSDPDPAANPATEESQEDRGEDVTSAIRELNNTLVEISTDLKATLELLTRVMED